MNKVNNKRYLIEVTNTESGSVLHIDRSSDVKAGLCTMKLIEYVI